MASFDLSNAGASGGNPFADLLGDDASISGVPAPTPTVTPIAATPTKPAPVATPTRTVPFLGADPLGLDDLLATNAPARSNVPPSTAEAARDTAIDPLGFDDLLGLSSAQAAADSRPAGKVDPFGFDDLLAPASPPAARPAAPIRASPATGDNVFGFDDLLSGPSHMPLLQEGNTPIIPEDFDPFAMPSEAPRNTSDPLSALSNNDVSLESISGNKVTIDGLMSSAGAGEPSPLDPIALGPARSSETDPLALFASEPILPSKHDDIFLGDVASNHVSELKSHFSMPHAVPETMPNALPEALKLHPAPMPPTPQVTTPQPVAPQATTSKPLPPANEQPAAPNQMPVDGRALAEAFLRGANLPLDTLPAGVTLEWMEMMGRFVATATDGAVELIASRALVKREVKADLTMIVVRNNNPLKFLPDGRSALIQMLGKKIPGFMGPVEAMEDAYVDLRAHQIGVVAGMRAALDEVLRRFDPAMLEKKLKSRSLMDSLVAANRKAKMWDLYAELFKDIYAEAQDDFQTLFGKAFLAAYESEIERFRQGRKP